MYHAMDAQTRYYTGLVFENLSLNSAGQAFEAVWLSSFWSPIAVQVDHTSIVEEFTKTLSASDIVIFPSSLNQHSIIYLNANMEKSETPSSVSVAKNHQLYLQRWFRKQYVSEKTCMDLTICRHLKSRSAFLVRSTLHQNSISDELIEAQETCSANEKLTLILHYKLCVDFTITSGDLVDIFIKSDKIKRGCRLSPRKVLSIDPSSGTITFPNGSGNTMRAAVEDVRPSITTDDLTAMVRFANDERDEEWTQMFLEVRRDVSRN